MLTPASFQTATLTRHPHGEAAARIMAAAVQSVEPGAALRRFVQRQGDNLSIDGQPYELPGGSRPGRIAILGLGKAALGMSRALVEMLADLAPFGLLIPKQRPDSWQAALPGASFVIQPGGHPVPDENSLSAGRQALALAGGLNANDVLICLISGGGSALMSVPRPGIALSDLQALTSALLASGARIDEINILRRQLDLLKGGGLARAAAPARVVSLILSDVVNNPLEAIASGPTVPDPTGKADALRILEKYGLMAGTPPSILRHLVPDASARPDLETKAENPAVNVIIGSNALAVQAALEQSGREGFQAGSLGSDWQGEARDVAVDLCRNLIQAETGEKPLCLVAGGETTVTIPAAQRNGRGGRNQELALAAVIELTGRHDMLLASLASDGEDGPTDAAGAVASGDTLESGLARGLSPQAFLERHDAYAYFNALDDLIKPGPSGTNVNDLTFLFRG